MLFGNEEHNEGVLVTKDWIISVKFRDEKMDDGVGMKKCAYAFIQHRATKAVYKKASGCTPMVTPFLIVPPPYS